MKITLSPKDEAVAKSFIKSLAIYGSSGTSYDVARKVKSNSPTGLLYVYLPAADTQPIYLEIIERQFTFVKNKLDAKLTNLAARKYFGAKTANGRYHQNSTRTPEQLATYIAWFCQNNNIIWPDVTAKVTPTELDAYKQTILGKALYDAGCFESYNGTQPAPAVPKATGTRNPGQPPVNGYKSTGPHSQDIPNLIGQANKKIQLPKGTSLYCVIADKIGKNTPCAYITPLKATNASWAKVTKTDAEEIKMGSSNGYTDCALFFTTQADAQAAATLCKNNKKYSKYPNIRVVVDKKIDSNGYFYVSTQAGAAYIKAKPLNEQMTEDVDEPKYENSSSGFKITDIDLYDEWSRRSIS